MPHSPMPRHKKTFGFSLIELLASIAIIAILAGILIPVGYRVMLSTESTRCASNLRQIGHTLQFYLNDHNMTFPGPLYVNSFGYTPSGSHLPNALRDYLDSPSAVSGQYKTYDMFYCPTCVRKSPLSKGKVKAYTLGSWVFGYPNGKQWPKNINEIDSLPTTMVVKDSPGSINRIDGYTHDTFENMLFADWHVEAVPVSTAGQDK